MLILFLGFGLIIAIMYLLYKTAKKGIEENNEKIEKIKKVLFEILLVVSLPISIYLCIMTTLEWGIIPFIIILIIEIIMIRLAYKETTNEKIRFVSKFVLLVLLNASLWVFPYMFANIVNWEYYSYRIYGDTALMLGIALYLIISIFLLSKTKKSLTAMKVIIYFSTIFMISNVVFYFGYEIFNKVSERVLI